jgi:RND family efflux transporter MFP subunit
VETDIPSTLFVIRDKINRVTCRLSIDDAQEMPLQIANYQAKANSSRMYRLYYRLSPTADLRIAPGMEVLVKIEYGKESDSNLVVPLSAVFNHHNQSYVWILNPSDSTVSKQAVEPGDLTGKGKVIIRSGLKNGDKVVVSGANVLNENEKVQVLQPASKTNIGGLL